jgi:N-acetylmuramoyl-L-alanine amidase
MINQTTNDALNDLIAQGTSMTKQITPLDLNSVPFKESPNRSSRPAGSVIDLIVIHHTGAGTFSGISSWLRSPQSKVSSHYLLGYGGELEQLVSVGTKASWHAGKSSWAGKTDLNNSSVGIEILNLGILSQKPDGFYYDVGGKETKYTGTVVPVEGKITYPDGTELKGWYVPYPEVQINKLVALCKALIVKHPTITELVTHYQIAPSRKNDPFGLDVEALKKLIF